MGIVRFGIMAVGGAATMFSGLQAYATQSFDWTMLTITAGVLTYAAGAITSMNRNFNSDGSGSDHSPMGIFGWVGAIAPYAVIAGAVIYGWESGLIQGWADSLSNSASAVDARRTWPGEGSIISGLEGALTPGNESVGEGVEDVLAQSDYQPASEPNRAYQF